MTGTIPTEIGDIPPLRTYQADADADAGLMLMLG
jgi:hypothetical protein